MSFVSWQINIYDGDVQPPCVGAASPDAMPKSPAASMPWLSLRECPVPFVCLSSPDLCPSLLETARYRKVLYVIPVVHRANCSVLICSLTNVFCMYLVC